MTRPTRAEAVAELLALVQADEAKRAAMDRARWARAQAAATAQTAEVWDRATVAMLHELGDFGSAALAVGAGRTGRPLSSFPAPGQRKPRWKP